MFDIFLLRKVTDGFLFFIRLTWESLCISFPAPSPSPPQESSPFPLGNSYPCVFVATKCAEGPVLSS